MKIIIRISYACLKWLSSGDMELKEELNMKIKVHICYHYVQYEI